jgi:murein DD-endopeptidase MepM/ murein hydrolase activator NlpD
VLIVVAAMLAATLISVAFGDDSSPTPGVVVEWLRGDKDPTATPAPTLPSVITNPKTPTPGGAIASPGRVTGFAYPVADGCLPSSDDLMPGAPRPYRGGVHEGVDFYDFDNCTPLGLDSEILAVQDGTVIRADLNYQRLTAEELDALEQEVANGLASNDPALLDTFRGRQVWIDHGNGVVTRYCHLNGIAGGISVGMRVTQGELIGYMGDSGTPESVTTPDTEIHLHFEIRVGDSYLGVGQSPSAVRALYERAFAP